MAKSLRSKREKRLRTLRREIVEPIYDKKESAKLAIQEAALAAPKLPVRTYNTTSTSMEITSTSTSTSATNTSMDVEMAIGGASGSLKPVGGIGKKWKKKVKIGKGKRGKGKVRRKHNI